MPNNPPQYVTVDQFQKLVDYAQKLQKDVRSLEKDLSDLQKDKKKLESQLKAVIATTAKQQTKIVNINQTGAALANSIMNTLRTLRELGTRLRDVESRLR